MHYHYEHYYINYHINSDNLLTNFPLSLGEFFYPFKALYMCNLHLF